MRKLHIASGAAVLFISLLTAGDVAAVGLHGTAELPDGVYRNCVSGHAEVTRWTPADGPPASVIADAFMSYRGSLWMALGYDETGFWSAEGYASDGCGDECDGLSLVHSDFTGKRRSFPVVDRALRERFEGKVRDAEFRQAIKARLFSLAATSWPVTKLSHDYKMKLPQYDEEGRIEKFTGWMAEVSKKEGFLLRFAPVPISHMCWCDQTWKAYTLATPKPRP